MARFIEYDSPFLSDLGITDSDTDTVNAAIEAATKCIQTYTGRKILFAQYCERQSVDQFGYVFLKERPVFSIDALYGWGVAAITLMSTATQSNFSTTKDAVVLNWFDGTKHTATFDYATYSTVGALATAIASTDTWGVSTFTTTGYPAADIVQGAYGDTRTPHNLQVWEPMCGGITTDMQKGIVRIHDHFRSAARAFSNYANDMRIIYTGGIDPPADLQQACAVITADFLNPGSGSVLTQTLGDFSTMMASSAIDRQPMTVKRILANYRTRSI